MKKKLFDNSKLQGDIEWGNIPVGELSDEELHNKNWNMSTAIRERLKDPEYKKRISQSMKGKTLEELVGPERAALGRQTRSNSKKGIKRSPDVIKKIVDIRKNNGSYASDRNGMKDKKHTKSTKEMQSIKAKIRQDLKRKLGLGKSDSIPKELLEKEYAKLVNKAK